MDRHVAKDCWNKSKMMLGLGNGFVNVVWDGLCLKCDGTRAETRFCLSAKWTNPFKLAEASVQSTAGSRGVRISGSNAGYTTALASFPFTSPPVRHLVLSYFKRTVLPFCRNCSIFSTNFVPTLCRAGRCSARWSSRWTEKQVLILIQSAGYFCAMLTKPAKCRYILVKPPSNDLILAKPPSNELINYREQSSSREANRSSASQ